MARSKHEDGTTDDGTTVPGERVVSADAGAVARDRDEDAALRPHSFAEFVGQRKVVSPLSTMVLPWVNGTLTGVRLTAGVLARPKLSWNWKMTVAPLRFRAVSKMIGIRDFKCFIGSEFLVSRPLGGISLERVKLPGSFMCLLCGRA